MQMFPRTTVENVSLSRMVIGTNWILGYSHRSVAQDNMIKRVNGQREAIFKILQPFMEHGIDTILGLYDQNPELIEAIKMAEEAYERKMIIIDTPIINVGDTKEARAEARKRIELSKELGATFCLPHHYSVEQLVCKRTQTIDRLPDYLEMIRENDMIPGVSAHMPELIVYSDLNEYDVQTYIQIYNCMGYLMQMEIEQINDVIWNAKKPVLTIKSMAAGRTTPFVGLNFSYNTIREQDMVAIGCLTPEEAHEDIEIGLAAIERRKPDLSERGTPKGKMI